MHHQCLQALFRDLTKFSIFTFSIVNFNRFVCLIQNTESVICPDNATIFQRDATINCPCNCADGTFREMSEGGSCPCSCRCADGSYDVNADDGTCPCECNCLGCMISTLGPNGCECPRIHDICPPCLVGEVQVFDMCICHCVPVDQCGILPTCVVGRRGDYCDQLDCRPCQ
ncbi:cell death abnormality protein 1-like, partial [Anneissia japonica]|uniref:cell death abnormality protein 1-like n=1 Tax=Anneissia japonica TaxID=1529436 RepID=UPI0014259747